MQDLGRKANAAGLLLVALGLFFDGWLGYEEDKIRVKHNPSALYIMAHTCLVSIVFGFARTQDCCLDCVVTGEFGSGVAFVAKHKVYILYLVFFGTTSAAGVLCVFFFILRFGALLSSILTTTRKFISILFSIYVFNHPCTYSQFLAVIVTFLAVSYNLYFEHASSRKCIKSN
eukprot:TRINITY_DN2596_c0_g1_i3.p1 TRINITY_DN2596_c0_g1~~TRINITY_DN2596_c0_g1_i3.p1  ORF type:complete len:173 (+),score=11.72 TRINITY_DN2596_c0_g1_i3:587-1105(+)